MTQAVQKTFQQTAWDYYVAHGRHDLPWRVSQPDGSFDPYKILVSEFMLQQTQVLRVIPKFAEFLKQFPTIETLAESTLAEVLSAWSGLGYNRRAKYLYNAAQTLISKEAPWKYEDLVACKGVGPNTAAAVLVYSYNQPLVFIETNIRTVYIHHFFHDQQGVADSDILALAQQMLDRQNPREWYWALMDYGLYLKQSIGNLNKLSKHYTKQSRFTGSRRQIRGRVIRLLVERPMSQADLASAISDERLLPVLDDLRREGLIRRRTQQYELA